MRKIQILCRILIIFFFLVGCSNAGQEMPGNNEKDLKTQTDAKKNPDASVDYIYGIPMDENAGVITERAADVYSEPSIKSVRLTQALFNQPISILEKENGWAKVMVVDGTQGWVKQKYVDSDISSIYGRACIHRIIVTSKIKEVTSHPTGGLTEAEAPMGTELFAFNSSGEAYEVFLPGNRTGWVRGSGIIHVQLNTRIPVTDAYDFTATALRFKGESYLSGGISIMGIDASGLIYICARINGIDLPRGLAGQVASGVEIKPEEARAGDLVFIGVPADDEDEDDAEGTVRDEVEDGDIDEIKDEEEDNEGGEGRKGKGIITCVGIAIGNGNYIYAGKKVGYVTTDGINSENAEGRVLAARRIFN